jgi:glycerate 2-kinase
MPRPPILSQEAGAMPIVRAGRPQTPLHVVVAPNAFKGSLSARAAAEAMAAGVRRAAHDAECVLRPIADGGDGSLDAFAASGFTRRPVTTHGPTGATVSASYATDGSTAVVELASTCGLARLPAGALAPMTSTTEGLGDAIRAALDERPSRIIACLGGSASTDGGTGLLVALGARLLDADGLPVPPGGAWLEQIAGLDLSLIDPRLRDTDITVAADVTSPLHGPEGAATVFAPQKGATPAEVARLDAGLRSWAGVLARATGTDVAAAPGAGAAGGTGAALLAACAATMAPGADLIADLIGLDDAIDGADLVVTGEGRLDAQSALGKGAVAVAMRARARGVPTLAVCGVVDLDEAALRASGFDAWRDCLSRAERPEDAMTRAVELVADATADVVRDWREP